MTSAKGKKQKLCVFCGGGNVSKEHFYSTWMHKLIGGPPQYEKRILNDVRKPETLTYRKRRGGLTTLKIRAACEVCNSGWMNRIEGAAKPHLTRLICGEPTVLDQASQLALARWIALKVIVGEHSSENVAVTPLSDRQEFMATLNPPAYFRLFIASHDLPDEVGYVRRTLGGGGGVILGDRVIRPSLVLDEVVRDIQDATFLVGRLFVYATAARYEDAKVEVHMPIAALRDQMRLWPPLTPSLAWPGQKVVGLPDMYALHRSWNGG